jgi:hypothetical protein
MGKTMCARIKEHYYEIKIMRGQNLSWREIAAYMSSKHHLPVEESYLRKTWNDLAAKETSPEKQEKLREKVKALMDIQPINISKEGEVEKFKRLSDKRERLLVAAQKRNKELEEVQKFLISEIEEGRKFMGKLLYGRLHGIATGKIVRGK